MSLLAAEDISHSFNDRWLFKNITLSVAKGQRLALVGINGSGKSTLLKILGEKLNPISGKIVKEKGLRIGYLEQDPTFGTQKTIEDFIYSDDNKQQQLIKEYERLIENEDTHSDHFNNVSQELSDLNAWEYEHEIKTILQRLSITDFKQEIAALSGGQRKRLALAKLLIDEPDVYILDEPTNHLDIEMIEWLEKFLSSRQRTVLMVTHDRYFLDNICNEIIELDEQQLFIYKGKYSYFLEKKAERDEEQKSTLQKNRNLLKKELEWMRRQPQARATKSKARIDAFYDLEAKTKNAKDDQKIELSTKVSRQGNKILELVHVSKSYGTKSIIEDFSYTFKKGDKIGLAGQNGTGKSTFLNLITGQISADAGTVDTGETTIYGYYKQSGLDFNDSDRVIDVVKNVAEYIQMADGSLLSASQLLTIFLFPPAKQHNMVSKLSGGEKKRLQLMKVLMANPNFLILDEPTNDLDIDTLNILEDFLEKFPGVLILVSHDRYLMDRLTDQLFILEGDSRVQIYNGNYTDYRLEKDKRKQITPKVTAIEKTEATATSKKKTKLSYKEEQELANLERDIPRLENEIRALQEELNTSSSDHTTLAELSKQIQSKESELDNASNKWLELIDLKENL